MEQVGFIGVGVMGSAIAERLIQNGVPVLAYDSDPKTLTVLEEKGASIALSIREIVDSTEIVFACLPSADISKNVALGPNGVSNGSMIKVYVEISTIGGDAAIEIATGLATFGIAFLDSPVVGGAIAAKDGSLGVLVAGPRAPYERAKTALEAFAGRLFYLGEKPGMAQTAKVVNNSVAYTAFLATCEAVAIGMKAGLDMASIIAILNQGSGANFFSQRIFPAFVLKGIFTGAGTIEIGVKDVELFLKEAERLRVEAPMAMATWELQRKVLTAGLANRDNLTMLHYFTDLAGLPRIDS